MKIDITPENAVALAKYAASAGHTPAEFLNEYLSGTMVPLFESAQSGELVSYLSRPRFHVIRKVDIWQLAYDIVPHANSRRSSTATEGQRGSRS